MTPVPAAEPWRARNARLLDDAIGLVERARAAGVEARLFGGLAILHHDEELRKRSGSRAIADIDLIVPAGRHRPMAQALIDAGYVPEERFNALNGHRRMVFKADEWHVDVLVGEFEMCHRIDMSSRFGLDYPTLPVTDLLLTKLQIVELNAKDAGDIADLIAGHEVRSGHGDWIDSDRLDALTRADWGLWRTVTGTLRSVIELNEDALVADRARELLAVLESSPKSTKWKLRARVGDRVPWYVLPDEVHQ